MRIFFSEYQTDYSSYTFSYAVYCLLESREELPFVYAQGFLPYTGDTSLQQNIFYLARSLRINLSEFKSTSENRRVDRKMEPLGVQMQVIPIADFDTTSADFIQFCTSFAEERFAGGTMNASRLQYILDRKLITHIFSFKDAQKPYGYVLAVITDQSLHYWFSFYDTDYMRSHSLGKWMMWRVIEWSQAQGLEHTYIGTCYREKSLYKVRDHKGTEFFDGTGWNHDTNFLKALCKADETSKEKDLLKSEWREALIEKPFT